MTNKGHVWLCPKCVPDEEFEELTLGTIFRTACHNCGHWIKPREARCVTTKTWEQWWREKKIPNHGCTRCPCLAILADTEDWDNPVCYDCYEAMGEPEEEPPLFEIMGQDFEQPTFEKATLLLCSWCGEPAVARGADGTLSCGSGQGDGGEHHCNMNVEYTPLHPEGIGWERIR